MDINPLGDIMICKNGVLPGAFINVHSVTKAAQAMNLFIGAVPQELLSADVSGLYVDGGARIKCVVQNLGYETKLKVSSPSNDARLADLKRDATHTLRLLDRLHDSSYFTAPYFIASLSGADVARINAFTKMGFLLYSDEEQAPLKGRVQAQVGIDSLNASQNTGSEDNKSYADSAIGILILGVALMKLLRTANGPKAALK